MFLFSDANGKTINKRIIFIDKPFPKMIWSPLEKKQTFYKKAAIGYFQPNDKGKSIE